MREPDPCFAGERLYRGLIQDWVDGYHRTGRLSSMAVTTLGTSFDRSKYQTEPKTTLGRKDSFVDVAQTTPEQVEVLRDESRDAQGQTRGYGRRMVDDPLDETDEDGPNEAHCQAWAVEEGQPPRVDLALPAGVNKRLRRKLAEQLTPMGLGRASEP